MNRLKQISISYTEHVLNSLQYRNKVEVLHLQLSSASFWQTNESVEAKESNAWS
jgi:hypothetical protein